MTKCIMDHIWAVTKEPQETYEFKDLSLAEAAESKNTKNWSPLNHLVFKCH